MISTSPAQAASRLSRRRCTSTVEDLALVIDGAPKIHPLAGNAHDHLVQVPSAAWSRPPLPQPAGDHRSELQHPAADRFIGNLDPTFGKQILRVAVAQGEAKISQIACCIIGGGKR